MNTLNIYGWHKGSSINHLGGMVRIEKKIIRSISKKKWITGLRAIAFKRIQGVEDFFKNARREGGSKR